MKADVVEMDAARNGRGAVSDFWLAQVEMRLDKIDYVVSRLERQLWIAACSGLAMVAIQVAFIVSL